MDQARVLTIVADALRATGHPDVTDVTVLGTPTVRAAMTDGSANYLSIAHVQPSAAPTPGKPSWPGHLQSTPTTGERGGR